MAHDPQIPSLQERLKAKVESRFSLTQMRASRYMGGIFLRSTQQLTYLGSSLGFSGSYLQMRKRFMEAFCSGVREGSFSTMQLGLRQPLTVEVTLSKKTLVSLRGTGSCEAEKGYLASASPDLSNLIMIILCELSLPANRKYNIQGRLQGSPFGGRGAVGQICVIFCNIQMVNLLSGSEVNPTKFPNAHRWDTLVRQHFHRYQDLIDAQTYRLQRIQRGLLSLPYPKYYNTELLTLNLLKRKQELGEVDQNEVDLYKNIDPCIATHFNRTFNSSFHIPLAGLAVGGALFGFSTYFGFSVPTRIVVTALPIAVNWLWMTRDANNEQHTLNFLNWVVGYRRAKCFAELHRNEFQGEEIRKLVGKGNLVDLGEQLFNMAGK